MSEEERTDLGAAVLAAAVERESAQRSAVPSSDGYLKSFGGTKVDTEVGRHTRGDPILPCTCKPHKHHTCTFVCTAEAKMTHMRQGSPY